MKKIYKAVITAHVIMVSAIAVIAAAGVRDELNLKTGYSYDTVSAVSDIANSSSEGLVLGLAVPGGMATVDMAAMLIPIVGPVFAALEYFDVIDFIDWF